MEYYNKTVKILSEKYNKEYMQYHNLINENRDFLEKLKGKLNQDIHFYRTSKLSNKSQKLSQIVKNVEEFYNNFDSEINENVKKVLRHEGQYRVIPMVHTGGTSRCQLDKTIFVSINGNCLDSINYIHELMHGIGQRIKLSKRPIDDSIGEIEGMFIDKISQAYFNKNGCLSDNDYDFLKKDRINRLKKNISNILEENEVVNIANFSFKEIDLIKIQRKIFNSPNGEILLDRYWNMCKEDYPTGRYHFRYVVGEIVAEQLYDQYLINPEKTLKKFKNFLSKNAEITLSDATQILLNKSPIEVMNDYLSKFEENENE